MFPATPEEPEIYELASWDLPGRRRKRPKK